MTIKKLFTRYLFTIMGLGCFVWVGWALAKEAGLTGSRADRIERKLEQVLREYSPGPEDANTWVVIYKYEVNHTQRCRTDAAIYPSGVVPLVSGCASTNKDSRKAILKNHRLGRGTVLQVGDPEVKGDLADVWDRYGLIGTANYPIYLGNELWGYVGLSFTEDNMRVMIGGELASEDVSARRTKELLARPLANAVERYYRLNPGDIDVELY